ncbi:MAG: GTPase [Planctomycetota bacterium]
MAPDLPCVLRQLTAAGRGGVAVLELEGPGAAQALARIGLAPGPAGSLRLVRPASEGEILDEALLCTWAADRIELHLHGSPPLLARLRTLLGDPGEGPLDGEAELEHALAHAPGERAARLVLAQMRGRWSAELARLQTLAPTEAARRIAQLVAAGRRARPYLVPRRVVLQGPVNAGKSTLFNALVGHERVIISDLAGTTRDAVLERIHLGEIPVDLVDTAGWREPGDDAVEARGQALGRDLAERADLVLFLEPPGYDGPRPKGRARGAMGICLVRRRMRSRSNAMGRRACAHGWTAFALRSHPNCRRVPRTCCR